MIRRTLATMSASSDASMTSLLASVHSKIDAALVRAKESGTFVKEPRLVAVSKTKPIEAVLEAYAAGQRIFGENYVQELVRKAADPSSPDDVQWHFIGTLQSNKAATLMGVKNLVMIETISSAKLATAVNKGAVKHGRETPIDVLVQVNTSAEGQKGGIEPEDVFELVEHIRGSCPLLRFSGLMTIGQYGRVTLPGESNPDFVALIEARDSVCDKFGLERSELEVSMGMSGDFEHAIDLGATNVRVGSTIFGARVYSDTAAGEK